MWNTLETMTAAIVNDVMARFVVLVWHHPVIAIAILATALVSTLILCRECHRAVVRPRLIPEPAEKVICLRR